MSTYEPKTILGLVGLLLVVAGVVAAAAIPAWLNNRRLEPKIDKVGKQLSNGQPNLFRDEFTKFREDFTKLVSTVNRVEGRVDQVHDAATETRDKVVLMESKFDEHLKDHP